MLPLSLILLTANAPGHSAWHTQWFFPAELSKDVKVLGQQDPNTKGYYGSFTVRSKGHEVMMACQFPNGDYACVTVSSKLDFNYTSLVSDPNGFTDEFQLDSGWIRVREGTRLPPRNTCPPLPTSYLKLLKAMDFTSMTMSPYSQVRVRRGRKGQTTMAGSGTEYLLTAPTPGETWRLDDLYGYVDMFYADSYAQPFKVLNPGESINIGDEPPQPSTPEAQQNTPSTTKPHRTKKGHHSRVT